MDSTITDNVVGSAKPNGSGPDGDARLLVTKVFRYLDALNQLRNPVTRHIKSQHWSKWFQDLPAHPCVTRGDRGFYSPTPEGIEGTPAAAFEALQVLEEALSLAGLAGGELLSRVDLLYERFGEAEELRRAVDHLVTVSRDGEGIVTTEEGRTYIRAMAEALSDLGLEVNQTVT